MKADPHKCKRLILDVIGEHESLRSAREAGVFVIPVRDRVIEMLVPYAMALSENLMYVPSASVLEKEDVQGACLHGLVEGVDSFKPAKGVLITTHVFNWVRKRAFEERIAMHWSNVKPPRKLAEKFISGGLTDVQSQAYLDIFVKQMLSPDEECMVSGLDGDHYSGHKRGMSE